MAVNTEKSNRICHRQIHYISAIPGLSYIPNYIEGSESDRLLQIIDQQPWLTDLKRRVQHYGYKYDYKKRMLDYSMFLGELPDWIENIARRLYRDKLIKVVPDQAIINEYNPGQGISSHIDCIPCFTETIISLSLGSVCVMEFTHSKTKEKIALKLETRSLVVLKDEARYEWKHAIPPRKKDKYDGEQIERSRRVSVTFRKVILV